MTTPTPRLTEKQRTQIDSLLEVMRSPASLTERLDHIAPSLDLELEVSATAFGCYILDLLDERTALVEQLAQAKAALDSSQAGLGGVCIALGLHPAAQARDDRGLLASAPIFDFCTALVARAEQAEKDRDALAAEVRAWRAFDEECKSRRGIIHAVHPTDISRATDASCALSRSREQA